MRIRKVRQMLKAFSDDTRLRIVNLLNRRELHVGQLCRILGKNQPNISKHLTRLRLLGIVGDRRVGSYVYYHLNKTSDREQRILLRAVTGGMDGLQVIKNDVAKLRQLKT